MDAANTQWYTSSMPSTNVREKKSATVGAKVPPSVKSFIGELMAQEDRTESYIILSLIERGIAAYNRDGLLREPERSEIKESPQKPHSKKTKAG